MNRDKDKSKDISIDTSMDNIRYVLRDTGTIFDMSFCPLCIKNEGQIDKIFDMSEGQNQGQNLSSYGERDLGNVPEGPWVHEQEQGGYASAPCNPVTMSPDMD